MQTDILIYDGFDELDALGPYEVLAHAGFEVALVTHGATDRIVASHGAIVVPHRELSDRPELLMLPSGGWTRRPPKGAWAEVQRGVLPPAIAERHAAGARVASVCTGAFLVAAGGLLNGRPATTHHNDVDDLDAMGVRVIRDARVVDDGDILTAAGVTSGIDLAQGDADAREQPRPVRPPGHATLRSWRPGAGQQRPLRARRPGLTRPLPSGRC